MVTIHFANRLIEDFLKKGFSVATCLHTLRLKGWARLPSQRTVHCHLKDGVIVLPSGGRGGIPPRPQRRPLPAVHCLFDILRAEGGASQGDLRRGSGRGAA